MKLRITEYKSKIINKLKAEWPLAIVLTACFIICFLILFVKPYVGMADNGDFSRIMHQNFIYKFNDSADSFFNFFIRQFGIMQDFSKFSINYFSSQTILIQIALLFNRILYSTTVFDIRFLAAVYLVLFIIAMGYLIKSSVRNTKNIIAILLIGLTGIFIFADVGYIAYFNSFFGEPLSYITMILCISSIILYSKKIGKDSLNLKIFFVSSFLLITAKQQNAPIALLCVIIALRLMFTKKETKHRMLCLIMCFVISISGIATFMLISDEFMNINKYHAMTRGVLLQAENPEKALEEFGIDPQYSILTETIYFDKNPIINPNSEILKENFYNHYSVFSISLYYLRHIDRLAAMLELSGERAFEIRPSCAGNYEQSAGKEPGAKSSFFSGWSYIKKNYIPNNFNLTVLVFLSAIALKLKQYIKSFKQGDKRNTLFLEMYLFTILIGYMQIFISIVSAGDADLEKHVFLFNVGFDIITFYLISDFIKFFTEKISNKVQSKKQSIKIGG